MMPPKRKNPFSSHNARKNPLIQKRAETEESPVDLSDTLAIEEVQGMVEKKVERGKKHVFRALKKIKVLEKLKLVKRLKIARKRNEDAVVKRLEVEFEILKTEQFDLNSLSSRHILRTLSKSKSISSSPLFPPWLVVQKESEGQLSERETAKSNLTARLYNSNRVKEEMVVILRGVKKAMGVDRVEIKAEGREPNLGKRKMQVSGENEGDECGGGDNDGDEGQDQPVVKKLRGLESFVEGAVDFIEEVWGGITDSEASEDSEMNLDAFTASFGDRVAGSSDGKEDQSPPQRGMDGEWSGEEEIEDDYQEDTRIANLPAAKMIPEQKRKSKAQQDDTRRIPKSKGSKFKPKRSTILPTLMSGYISGSDSDIDANYYKDKNGKKKGPAEPKERKNRMGQQARRALWEKKFGKNADHVKREEAEQGRKKIERRIKQSKREDEKKGDGAGKEKKGKEEVEGPLHPSWEAARKMKEQQAKVQEAVMSRPMGKKIVFS